MSLVLGENIKTARKEAGLRQEDLAELVGVSQSALSQFEKGRVAPSNETFQAIRKELKKRIGENRLDFYLPTSIAAPSETVAHRLAVRAGGAEIKVLGRVAAGRPIQPFEMQEPLSVPAQMIARNRNTFALQVQGASMTGYGIFHGDIIILHANSEPLNGQIIVAQIGDYEYTLKSWHRDGREIKLSPANPDFDDITFNLGHDEVKCIGEYAGLIRFAK